jgi:hypothetical protein
MNLRHTTRALLLDPYAAGHDGVRSDYYVVRTEPFTPGGAALAAEMGTRVQHRLPLVDSRRTARYF